MPDSGLSAGYAPGRAGEDVRRGLWLSSTALLFAGYLALATTEAFTASVLVIPLMLMLLAPLGEWLDAHYRTYRRLTSGITIFFLILYLVPAVFVYRSVLESVTTLIIYIQAYTMLHRKTSRNYYHLYLMAFFLLLAATVLAPEPEIGLIMLLFLVSSVVGLMFLQFHIELRANQGGRGADILPLGSTQNHLLAPPSRILDRGLVGLIAMMLVVAVGLTLGLFLATPRMEAGLLGRTSPGFSRTGLSQRLDLARGGRVLQDHTAVMRVEFPQEPEGMYEGLLLWRCTSLDDYRQDHWTRRGLSRKTLEPFFAQAERNSTGLEGSDQPGPAVSRAPFSNGRLVRQMIYMDNVPLQGLPALPYTQSVGATGVGRAVRLGWDGHGDFTILMESSRGRRLQYQAWSEVPEYTPEKLRAASSDYKRALFPNDYVLLTQQNLEPRTLDLVDRIVQDTGNVYDAALAVAEFLNTDDYAYTLDLPDLPRDHPVDAFLHDTKIGHCQLYASAMALMLRSQGIPTRVASGFRGGDWNPMDRSYVVRADMAHLWVEVFFAGVGWVPFDPTPQGIRTGWFATTPLGQMISRYGLRAKMVWYQRVIGFNQGIQIRGLKELSLGVFGLTSQLFSWEEYKGRAGLQLVTLLRPLTIIALVALLVFFLKRRPKAQAYQKTLLTSDQALARRRYRQIRRRLEHYGLANPGETAEEIGQRLAALRGQWTGRERVEAALETYNAIRFGMKPLTREDEELFRAAAREFRPAKPSTVKA